MDKQLFCGEEEPARELFESVVNTTRPDNKPDGGLWTSTLISGRRSDWVSYCEEMEFYDRIRDRWLLEVIEDPFLFVIDSLEDLLVLYELHGYVKRDVIFDQPLIDWEGVAKTYDGVHLTKKGQLETHMPEHLPHALRHLSLFGWDCECTLWFRWCFLSVTLLEEEVEE